ncbi:MAG: hypothetical protein IJG63_01090 [Oscillospiraceae bacterium]|nr:hypothetical protein [Oscillospiraceae bacterium]
MTKEELFRTLKDKFRQLLEEHNLESETISVSCRSLSAEEAIGDTIRKDFPIITGNDVMIQAEYCGGKGQAFTDAPALFEGSLMDISESDIESDPHCRGIFIASLNAVMSALDLCSCTAHCRREGPELCAGDMRAYLDSKWPDARRIGLIGYQPALLQMLSESGRHVRVLDLNPANIGEIRHGVSVEDGASARDSVVEWADLILCTGSTLCNGTITDYLDLHVPVLFFGITAAGASRLMGWQRVCFADNYPG